MAASHRPVCGKCGKVMTPEDSRIHPEYFLHDACLPEELKIQKVAGSRPVSKSYDQAVKITAEIIGPNTTEGKAIRRLCAPPLVEDIEQRITSRVMDLLKDFDTMAARFIKLRTDIAKEHCEIEQILG